MYCSMASMPAADACATRRCSDAARSGGGRSAACLLAGGGGAASTRARVRPAEAKRIRARRWQLLAVHEAARRKELLSGGPRHSRPTIHTHTFQFRQAYTQGGHELRHIAQFT
jgi:hypothetical protein